MNNTVETQLRDLVELLTDSEKGYAEAAQRADDPKLKELFLRSRAGRTPAIVDLGLELKREGGSVPDGGTLKGTLHRAWMDIRSALSKAENTAMLTECERGETYLVNRYEEVMKNDQLPPHVRADLESQLTLVRSNLTAIESLRKEFENVEH